MKIMLFMLALSASGIFGFTKDYRLAYKTDQGSRTIGYYDKLSECKKDKPTYVAIAKKRYKNTGVICEETFIKKLKTKKGTDNEYSTQSGVLD